MSKENKEFKLEVDIEELKLKVDKELADIREYVEEKTDYILDRIKELNEFATSNIRTKKIDLWGDFEKLKKDINKNILKKIPNEKIKYTVNGEVQEISAKDNKQTAADILKRAEFVPVKLFRLHDYKLKIDYFDENEQINIDDGDEF